ncbi:MAG: cysteine desulfurase-like protein [Gemmatimonadaceae bacterium]
MTSVISVDEIRACFPALSRRHAGRTVAYFDGPGGTQTPREVVGAMSEYLYHHNANMHWMYPTSVETDAAIAEARNVFADFLNAAPDEIVFGANMTTLTFHLARALGRGWGAGDVVVVTDLEHHANVAPWRALERERGITVRSVGFAVEDGMLDWDSLEAAIRGNDGGAPSGERTRLLAIGAASNALGTVTDVARAARLARDAGALVFVDAVHFAPHCLLDVATLDCDFLACSAYKFYGPHVGVLYGRRVALEALDVPKLEPAPDSAPERLETGTQNHEGIVGAAAAVDFLASLAGSGGDRRTRLARTFCELRERGQALIQRLWTGLGTVPGVRLFGPGPGMPRTPTVSFTVAGRPADDVALALAERGVFVSSGDFYASTIVERLGQAEGGLVRAGCACYTTEEEVDALVIGVAGLVP